LSVLSRTAAWGRLCKAQAALAGGDLVAARRWADDAVSATTGAFLSEALTTRARVAIAQGEPGQANATPTTRSHMPPKSAPTCSSPTSWNAGYDASVGALRNAMGEHGFESEWAGGAALSTEEAIACAQRGRGERKRLVSEGLGNNGIATRLSCHRARRNPTSLTSTASWVSPPACSSPRKPPATAKRRTSPGQTRRRRVPSVGPPTAPARRHRSESAAAVGVSRRRRRPRRRPARG
jgi:hypothetical protein